MLLENLNAQAPVEAGQYKGILLSYAERSKDGKPPYVELIFRLEDGRQITENKFDRSVQIAVNQLKTQTHPGVPTVPAIQVLDQAKSQSIDIFVSFSEVNGISYRNVNFTPQLAAAPVAETAVTTEDSEDADI